MRKHHWKNIISVAAIGSLAVSLLVQPAWAGTPEYRLYNHNSGEHFYTMDANERNSLVRAGWNYEGCAWIAADKNSSPVYRLYNPNTGDHHYTLNSNEKEMLKKAGWRNEGIGWYSAPCGNGKPVYRLYNPNTVTGSHHYTVSIGERDTLVKAGWRYEGIGWYAEDSKADIQIVTQQNNSQTSSYEPYAMEALSPNEKACANRLIYAIEHGITTAGNWYSDHDGTLTESGAKAVTTAVYSVIDPLNFVDKIDGGMSTAPDYGYSGARWDITWCRIDVGKRLYEANLKALAQVHAFIDPYVSPSMREDQKVRVIHDRIKEYLTYKNGTTSWQQALQSHTGVCQAYTELFHVCCYACGIQDRIAIGTVYNSDPSVITHAWNYVKVNGSWYYIDVTWDDCLQSDAYYLSQTLWPDHKVIMWREK